MILGFTHFCSASIRYRLRKFDFPTLREILAPVDDVCGSSTAELRLKSQKNSSQCAKTSLDRRKMEKSNFILVVKVNDFTGKTNSGSANFSLKFLYIFHLIIGSINIYKTSAAKTNKNRISPTAMIVMSRQRSFERASHRYTPIEWSTVLLRERFFGFCSIFF